VIVNVKIYLILRKLVAMKRWEWIRRNTVVVLQPVFFILICLFPFIFAFVFFIHYSPKNEYYLASAFNFISCVNTHAPNDRQVCGAFARPPLWALYLNVISYTIFGTLVFLSFIWNKRIFYDWKHFIKKLYFRSRSIILRESYSTQSTSKDGSQSKEHKLEKFNTSQTQLVVEPSEIPIDNAYNDNKATTISTVPEIKEEPIVTTNEQKLENIDSSQ